MHVIALAVVRRGDAGVRVAGALPDPDRDFGALSSQAFWPRLYSSPRPSGRMSAGDLLGARRTPRR
ncbi:hypothetical protein ACFQ60_00990 [Streptomyces zhihengii]